MKQLLVVFLSAFLVLVSGCGANAIASKKMVDTGKMITKVNVVFIPNELKYGDIGLILKSQEKIKISGNSGKIIEGAVETRVPAVISNYGLSAQVKLMPETITEGAFDVKSIYNDNPTESPILTLRPQQIESMCVTDRNTGKTACYDKYRIQAILLDGKTGNRMWFAVVDLPYPTNFDPKYLSPVNDLSEQLIELWSKAGMIQMKPDEITRMKMKQIFAN